MSETAASIAKKRPQGLTRLVLDLGPLLVFFGTYSVSNFFFATGAFMLAMVSVIVVSLIFYRHVSVILWFSAFMVIVLGGLTIWLHDKTFIKMKPTVYYTTVAGLLAYGAATGRPYLKYVLEEAFPGLNERGWIVLTRNFGAFFLAMALLNEVVWRTQTEGFWLGFKIWGAIPLTMLFSIAHVPYVVRNSVSQDPSTSDTTPSPRP
jgi:intracellular septation protein